MKNPRWKSLKFINPEKFLRGIQAPQSELDGQSIYGVSSQLRDRRVRSIEEDRRCAAFCYGFGAVTGKRVLFSDFESSDYDYVLSAEHEGHAHFIPLQMKQLVPEWRSATTSLQLEIDKLAKYRTSSDLVVAIHVNRRVNIQIEKLDLSSLNINELWLFGVLDQKYQEWLLLGDIKKPTYGAYRYKLPAHA